MMHILVRGVAAVPEPGPPRSGVVASDPARFVVVVQGESTWSALLPTLEQEKPTCLLVLAHSAESAGIIREALRGEATKRIRPLVLPWTDSKIPVVDDCADLVILGERSGIDESEIMRVLRPHGRMYAVGRKTRVKPRPAELDTWPQFLRDASNNAVSRDARIGPPRSLQWKAPPLWTRNHHLLNSVSTVLADDERVVAVIDEAPSASVRIPSRWAVVARNAFNGLLIWKRRLVSWADWRHPFRSGPVQLSRLLALDSGCAFLPLSAGGPVSALRLTDGTTLRTYAGTDGAEEIVPAGADLFVIVGRPHPAQTMAGAGWRRRRGKKPAIVEYRRLLLCLDRQTGAIRWRWKPFSSAQIEPLSLAVAGRRVYFQLGAGVTALDRTSGREVWRTANAGTASRSGARLMTPSTLVAAGGFVLWADGRKLHVLDSVDGRERWQAPARAGFRSPTDVFVLGDTVWCGPDFSVARRIGDGTVVREAESVLRLLQTAGHHHRCYRERATNRFLICGKRGLEFLDTRDGAHSRNDWIRGTCQYGVLPANGMVITPPYCCGCYMEAKLAGFLALRRERSHSSPGSKHRLERGPAWGRDPGAALPADAWATWRGDAPRSSSTSVPIPVARRVRWSATVGSSVTAPVIAGGRVIIADPDRGRVTALRIEDGKRLWTFEAEGGVDEPPSCTRNLVIFGTATGWVYCLDARDGALRWRFRAARAPLFLAADERIESVWPVPAAVLIRNGLVCTSAGRSSHLDGGIDLYALAPDTGTVVHHQRLVSKPADGPDLLPGARDPGPPRKIVQNAVDRRTESAPDRADAFSMQGGNRNDVLCGGRNGEPGLWLRWQRLRDDLTPDGGFSRHLFSTSLLNDGSEVHRSHYVLGTGDFRRLPVAYSWIVNRGNPGPRFGYEPAAVFGLLLAFDTNAVCGVRRRGGVEGYEAFVMPVPRLSPDAGRPDFRPVRKGEPHVDPLFHAAWRRAVSLRPRALVLGPDGILMAGMPALPPGAPSPDAVAAFEGKRGGLALWLDRSTGKEVGRMTLLAAPVWNGAAVDRAGKIVLSLVNGSVVCLDARAAD